MMQIPPITHMGYPVGHCWYYLLGGKVLSPKQIRQKTLDSGYQGYAAEDIALADRKAEPQRSSALRQLRAKFEADLQQDISRYRQCVLALHRYRKVSPITGRPTCAEDVHVNLSLKYAHLVNNFAHLATIDNLLNRQGDLFGDL
ncbi:hypothetical protein [Roseibium alexandrii]|uniref:hypothetical protein n=1 Tax=Roseibium alexandrii TaxID=388408 RepID=UPI0037526D26